MAKVVRVETARATFAEVTGALEDAALVAADAQATPDLAAARDACDRLIARLDACRGRLLRSRQWIA